MKRFISKGIEVIVCIFGTSYRNRMFNHYICKYQNGSTLPSLLTFILSLYLHIIQAFITSVKNCEDNFVWFLTK